MNQLSLTCAIFSPSQRADWTNIAQESLIIHEHHDTTSTARLSGRVQLPGDKSISHRFAMLGAIAEGVTRIDNFATSQDCHSTLACLRLLGVPITVEANHRVTIQGRGLFGLESRRMRR